MTDPIELFAKLGSSLEDLHAITLEGRAADQPSEMLLIIAEQICNGLYRAGAIVDQIKIALRAS